MVKTVAAFERPLQLEPTHSEASLFAGRAYYMANDLGKASTAFQKALAIDSDYTEARISYAACCWTVAIPPRQSAN